MDTTVLIQQAKRIMSTLQGSGQMTYTGAHAQACEFLRVYAGPKSAFLESMSRLKGYAPDYGAQIAAQVMESFIQYVEAGLHSEIPPERRAQLDVVSDFLEQAAQLLETQGVHPAAPAVLIGATLEEFLRTWVETQAISLGNRKPGLDAYAAGLRDADQITKQDVKDIASWGGVRNHAAHGEWDQVSDRQRVTLMLEGVNLFMRRYGAG